MQKDELSDLTKRDLYEMSKAEQVDIHAKVWFQREPWYLTEKRMRERRGADGQGYSAGDECSGV